MRTFRRLRQNKCGFTLFELLITITIVALLLSVVVGRMDDYLETDMKKATNRLAATIRYLYNKSATEGLYLRLILDLSEQTYWVEATREPFLMAMSDSKKGDSRKEEEKKKKEKKEGESGEESEAAKTSEGKTAGSGELPKVKIEEPKFSQVESYLLKATSLPERIFFKDVSSEHEPNPVESGQASIYFFPNGYVEHAVINFKDEEDELNYSLETNPVIGTVKIENEYKNFEKK